MRLTTHPGPASRALTYIRLLVDCLVEMASAARECSPLLGDPTLTMTQKITAVHPVTDAHADLRASCWGH